MATNRTRDAGLLLLRLGVGGVLVAHGAQKLFGWFGGGGVRGTAAGMDAMGFQPAGPSAVAAGLAETTGGALTVLGLATPVGGAIAAGNMITAASVHTANGFFNTGGGLEYPALLGLSAAALAVTGPGEWSLDAAFGHRLNRSEFAAVGLAAALAGSVAMIMRRRRIVAARAAAERATRATDAADARLTTPTPS